MDARRLRAPSADGALLAEPPLPEAGARLDQNAAFLGAWDHDFQGRRAGRLRPLARGQALARARDYLARAGFADVPAPNGTSQPWIVTGHQPELFHPGVWVKNFATAAIARDCGGVGLNLVVDNDIPKASSIRVPRVVGDAIKVQRVDYDEWAGEIPFEDLRIRDEALFSSFADRVRGALDGAVADPLIEDFWPRTLRRCGRADRVGERFALARREVEASWGIHNFEVPLSAVCETEAFLWFACHLLAQLPRFQAVHNDELLRYRVRHGIRSRHHPVPALTGRGDWLEAPFWIWRAEEPRRRPLLARQRNPQVMELRIDGEDDILLEIPLGPDREACCAVDRLLTLPDRKLRLRTRALTTTMFARLLLGDLFLHGIGGAKYDELGDAIVRRFFGIEPPEYLTLSMTLWLGLTDSSASIPQLHDVERALRDLTFNPDRHLANRSDLEARRWIEAKRQAIAWPVSTHVQRVGRFREIRRCNEALQAWVGEERRHLTDARSRMRAGLQRNAIARNREYASVLHSVHRLQDAMGRIAPGMLRI